MRFEVMVREVDGTLRVHYAGDTTREAVGRSVGLARVDPTVDFAGVALDGVREYLWAEADVAEAVASGEVQGLADRGRVLRWAAGVRGVLRGMEPGESLTVSEIASSVGGATGEVREAVHEAVRLGFADPVNASWSRVERSVWVIPPE